ncbi:JmjC domain-containing protein 4 [Bulinus truncatus]|nr:JmjC domain-containing protein 4 [Bulinus truncatus]
MDFPEIDHCTAITSKPQESNDPVYHGAIYIHHLLPYEYFFQDIFLKNQLCIIGPSATMNWASRKDWVLEDGSPDLNFLLENYGETTVPVANCNEQEFSTHPKAEMTVKNYVLYWQKQKSEAAVDGKCLYLKDWHFYRQFPSYHAYTPPAFLCSDWMNEFWDVRKDITNKDDYRFVYMGPKNSWTPFHSDVLCSYSWSANICGLKKWIIFPPGCETKLQDKYEQMIFDLRSEKLYDPDLFPKALEAMDEAITVFQNPGEIIFIPSGWYHQVFNLEDTISINHNWINGCNSHIVWAYIKNRLAAVQKEISDCKEMKDWNEHCQVVLKADSGINYIDFYNFLATIATHRVKALHQYIMDMLLPKFVQKICMKDSILSILPVQPSVNYVSLTGDGLVYILKNHMEKNHSHSCHNVINCDMVNSYSGSSSYCDTKDVMNPAIQSLLNSLPELNWMRSVKHDLELNSSVIVFVDDNFNQTLPVYGNECFVNDCNQENKVKKTCLVSELDGSLPDRTLSVQDSSNKIQSKIVANYTEMGQEKVTKHSIDYYSENVTYLCLLSGAVVKSGTKTVHKKDDLDSPAHILTSLDDHQHCPHWAHCGPNLALFDILRALDLLRDILDQADFQGLLINPAIKASLLVAPSELINSIEYVIDYMKLI